MLDVLERNDWRVESMGRAGDGFERCSLSRLVLVEDTMRVEVARLDWALDGMEALESGRGMVDLSVTVDDARITAQTADPWVDYMLQQQNRRNRIDAALELQWDLDAGALRVRQANVSFPGENSLNLSSAVEGLGPEVLQGRSDALLGLSVRSLALSVENTGFLDGLILGALIGRFSTVAGAPETVVSATQAEAKEIVEAWPEDVVDAASKGALSDLIDAALELQWDLDAGALRVRQANGSLPVEYSLNLSSAVEGLGPEVLQGRADALLGLSVRSLALSVENTGFLDGLILGALIGRFSTVAGAPETVVSATQAEAKEIVEAWPEDVVDAASKAALSDLIDAAPVPWGQASLALDAEEPMPLSRFLSPIVLRDPLSPEAIAAAFDGVEVRFRFEPADDGG